MRHERQADIGALEAELLARIDAEAEGVRGLFVTNTASQAGVYLVKEAEAKAFVADSGLDEAETPNLTREAARTGQSRMQVAMAILAKAAEWREISAVIEDIRLGAKDAVRAAATAPAKRAAAVVDWSAVTDLA